MRRILDYLNENTDPQSISFALPGHKNRIEVFEKYGCADIYHNALKADVGETENGLLKSSSEYYANLYGVKKSELLTCGAGAGIQAAILSCVPRGGKLILGRNSGEYAFDTLRIGDIKPIYIRPGFNTATGLQERISPDEIRIACEDNPDAGAVLITSPNYYGIFSDISAIADVVHTYGMTLIVDQSEGAHFKFFDAINRTATAAEDLGADIVVNAVDRTLLGMRGTAVVNICTNRVDIDVLEAVLRFFGSGRPSQLALGSMDVNEKILRGYGGRIVRSWMTDLAYIYRELGSITGLRLITTDSLDPTKISISMAQLGISAERLNKELRANNIIAGTIHGQYLMLITGVGNVRSDYEKAARVIKGMAESYANGSISELTLIDNPNFALACKDVPKKKIKIPLYQADGRVLYDSIITYPPGIPIVCPGEVMNMKAIAYLSKALSNEEMVTGVDDEGYVFVGE